jgi:hypothetical protein
MYSAYSRSERFESTTTSSSAWHSARVNEGFALASLARTCWKEKGQGEGKVSLVTDRRAVQREEEGRAHLLVQSSSKSPVEESPRLLPDRSLRTSLGLHSTDSVVQIGVLGRDLDVGRVERLLPRLEVLLGLGSLIGGLFGVVRVGLEGGVGRVKASHGGEDLVPSELDLDDTGRLYQMREELRISRCAGLNKQGRVMKGGRLTKDTSSSVNVGVHFHLGVVDGGIEDDPSTTSELSVRDDVDEDGLPEARETVDDLGSLLEDLVVLQAGKREGTGQLDRLNESKDRVKATRLTMSC